MYWHLRGDGLGAYNLYIFYVHTYIRTSTGISRVTITLQVRHWFILFGDVRGHNDAAPEGVGKRTARRREQGDAHSRV